MRTILVPTDFSKNAAHAIAFAVRIAKKEKSSLVLLHVYNLAYINPELPFRFVAAEASKIRKESKTQLNAISAQVRAKGVKCTIQVKEGMLVDVVKEMTAGKRIGLVVMGTKGATGLKEVFLGSNTAKVIERAGCPVLAVPQEASAEKIRNIAYASDYLDSDIAALKALSGFGYFSGAHIAVVHVAPGPSLGKSEKLAVESFLDRIRKETGNSNISFSRISSKEAGSGLRRYIDEHAIGLFVMSTHTRSVFDRLFGKSITRRLAHHIQVPLLVFHHKKNPLILN